MTIWEALLLLGAGVAAGCINSVSTGGSFFTYPAMLLVGLTPLQAAATTLGALTPGNLAAVPEYLPEVRAQRHRYPEATALTVAGGAVGILLLRWTGADLFETLVPWIVLVATAMFAASPRLASWATERSPLLATGWLGAVILFLMAVYLTYFGSGVGAMFFAMLTVRGFGGFHSANAAKNVVMTIGTVMATVAYAITGWIAWGPMLPVLIGSAIGGRVFSRVARTIPVRMLRGFVIATGLAVAGWQFVN